MENKDLDPGGHRDVLEVPNKRKYQRGTVDNRMGNQCAI